MNTRLSAQNGGRVGENERLVKKAKQRRINKKNELAKEKSH